MRGAINNLEIATTTWFRVMDLACVPTRHMLYSLPIELHFNFSLINLICDWGCASSQILRMSINSLDGCLVCHMCCYRLLGCHADQSIKRQRGAGWKGHRQAAGRQHSMDILWIGLPGAQPTPPKRSRNVSAKWKRKKKIKIRRRSDGCRWKPQLCFRSLKQVIGT